MKTILSSVTETPNTGKETLTNVVMTEFVKKNTSAFNTPNLANISARYDDQGNLQLDNSDLGMVIEMGTPNPNNQREANLQETTSEMKRTGTFGTFK